MIKDTYKNLGSDPRSMLQSAELLYSEDKYMDCANRCYYAMMFSLKTLLENQGKLPIGKLMN